MSETAARWPIFLRTATVAAVVGCSGLFMYRFGQFFVDPTANPQFHDNVPIIGRALMSACSLLCLAVLPLAVVNAFRTGAFTWLHAIVLLAANAVIFADAVVNAHPW